ncbi:helix-turn-helix domain-containing protein [Actinomadura sp. GC306]|uniref:helix-turn-helix domain-containing protein n=1 Tax=Actinomadura sp. GC306 TaxID=2530367 RepID=UPI001050AF87|nr:helix-turn-helix domain-containing protein [Actinomadura sp. GC306]TDC71805.1 helix-turn-helix domain-containing protein [Actinomadura sp. GC306]
MDVVSTAEVPPQERFAFWREVCSKVWVPLDARCEPGTDRGFRARVALSDLGPVRAAVMTTMPHSVHRTVKLIRREDPEALLLTCAVRGPGVLGEQDGRRAESQAGDLCLFDSSRPYLAGVVPGTLEGRVLVLQFHRSLLPVPPRDLQRLTAVRIPGDRGIGALSSQFLLRLARHMDEFSPSDTARLSTLTLDVVTSALADALDAQDAVPPQVRQRALMAEIRTFIQKNLGDDHLTPETIAAAHHISLRYLHRLFQENGHTVAGWVRERRLEQCRRDLAEPRMTAHPISAIAARWGFSSPTHFSHVFRTAYGLSPSRFRQQCAQTEDLCIHP